MFGLTLLFVCLFLLSFLHFDHLAWGRGSWSLCLSCICLLARHTLICVTFSLPPGGGGWLRLLLVALPGLFCSPFRVPNFSGIILTNISMFFVCVMNSFFSMIPVSTFGKVLYDQCSQYFRVLMVQLGLISRKMLSRGFREWTVVWGCFLLSVDAWMTMWWCERGFSTCLILKKATLWLIWKVTWLHEETETMYRLVYCGSEKIMQNSR